MGASGSATATKSTFALSHFRTLPSVNRKNVEDIYPLSPLQQGMLFHALYSPETGAYVEQWPLLVEGPLDVDAFHRAFQRAVDRHAALRTGFVWENVPQPLQVVLREARLPAERLDWSGAADGEWRGAKRAPRQGQKILRSAPWFLARAGSRRRLPQDDRGRDAWGRRRRAAESPPTRSILRGPG